MEVIFSDNKTYKFTEYQLTRIPYFENLINSSTWIENKYNKFIINHNSLGFDFIHIFATLDEIDILDPGDNYLFVMKQCDYFCYDKLKILLDKKYGFRKIISNTNNNIGKKTIMKLKYLGTFTMHVCSIRSILYVSSIIPLYEHEFYTNDNEINDIYKNRYKSKTINYYFDLIKKIYNNNYNILSIISIDYINYQINIDREYTGLSPNIALFSDKYFYQSINTDNKSDYNNSPTITVYEKI